MNLVAKASRMIKSKVKRITDRNSRDLQNEHFNVQSSNKIYAYIINKANCVVYSTKSPI